MCWRNSSSASFAAARQSLRCRGSIPIAVGRAAATHHAAFEAGLEGSETPPACEDLALDHDLAAPFIHLLRGCDGLVDRERNDAWRDVHAIGRHELGTLVLVHVEKAAPHRHARGGRAGLYGASCIREAAQHLRRY